MPPATAFKQVGQVKPQTGRIPPSSDGLKIHHGRLPRVSRPPKTAICRQWRGKRSATPHPDSDTRETSKNLTWLSVLGGGDRRPDPGDLCLPARISRGLQPLLALLDQGHGLSGTISFR